LPRKFKISITGCATWCSYPEINDIGATAVRRADGTTGFHIRVGGGLSTRPRVATLLPAVVRPDQMVDVALAVAGIFRDSSALRTNRAKARMKFLFLVHGWTVERFLAEVERRIGYRLDPAEAEAIPDSHARDHVGVHPQSQPGLFYAGFSILSGRITPAQLRTIADLAERHGRGRLRNTIAQNIVVLDVPRDRLAALADEARIAGIPLDGSPLQRGTVSCTGSEFCKLALAETKALSIALAGELERRLPGLHEDVTLHLAGCPNSCGQHWIADVGLQGVRISSTGSGGAAVEEDGFDIFVGGGLGEAPSFARRVGYRAAARQLPDVLERLFNAYLATRDPGERFQRWSARHDARALKTILAGANVASSDPSTAA
ncbi:MAG TPA: hypothetical protein VHV78_09215, partial [Gemmatimonadaceae bacterium]|nr:hypothetical protein [Gemmatimonadaceae bacterium]